MARLECLTGFTLRDQSQDNGTAPFIMQTLLNENLMSCQINYKNSDGGKHNDYTKNRPTSIATHFQFIELEGKLMNMLITKLAEFLLNLIRDKSDLLEPLSNHLRFDGILNLSQVRPSING